MQALVVPLAAMIPTAPVRSSRRRAPIELSPTTSPFTVIDDEGARRDARDAADVAVTVLAFDHALANKVDFARVRALVEREVQIAGGRPVCLAPLLLYLDALAPRRATRRALHAVVDGLRAVGVAALELT